MHQNEFVQVITQTKIARVYHCRFWSSPIWSFHDDEDAEAGGLSPLTDNLRTADEDNPKGYHEFEQVKKIPDGDISWVDEQTNFSVIYLDYNAMLADPTKYARQVNQVLDNSLNPQEMAGVMDPNLYRQRK